VFLTDVHFPSEKSGILDVGASRGNVIRNPTEYKKGDTHQKTTQQLVSQEGSTVIYTAKTHTSGGRRRRRSAVMMAPWTLSSRLPGFPGTGPIRSKLFSAGVVGLFQIMRWALWPEGLRSRFPLT